VLVREDASHEHRSYIVEAGNCLKDFARIDLEAVRMLDSTILFALHASDYKPFAEKIDFHLTGAILVKGFISAEVRQRMP
jgi:hypothetical protein